jgi:hypothetical protein
MQQKDVAKNDFCGDCKMENTTLSPFSLSIYSTRWYNVKWTIYSILFTESVAVISWIISKHPSVHRWFNFHSTALFNFPILWFFSTTVFRLCWLTSWCSTEAWHNQRSWCQCSSNERWIRKLVQLWSAVWWSQCFSKFSMSTK